MLQRRLVRLGPDFFAQIYSSTVGVARALAIWGIGQGDRVAILSENRPEWTITDFAAARCGAVTVPIYSTQTAEQTSYILNDSGARVIAVSNEEPTGKGADHSSAHAVERIMVMDEVETEHRSRCRN